MNPTMSPNNTVVSGNKSAIGFDLYTPSSSTLLVDTFFPFRLKPEFATSTFSARRRSRTFDGNNDDTIALLLAAAFTTLLLRLCTNLLYTAKMTAIIMNSAAMTVVNTAGITFSYGATNAFDG